MNNEVLQNIRTRRSCRAYTAQPVEPEKLKAILEAGTWAASGHGWQAAKIVVLQDAAEIAELERMNAAVLGNPDGHPFYGSAGGLRRAGRSGAVYLRRGRRRSSGQPDACRAQPRRRQLLDPPAREEFDSPEGKALLKKWGVDERYIGVGHCILGYAANEAPAPKPRKNDYVIYR